jgi:mannose-6-phosphate isomerase
MLASHKDGTNTVLNGELAGKTFDEALKIFGGKERHFPILIKLIDAKDRLSVQVHPEDSYALKVEGEPGKTEMWYIVDCDEGAQLIYGFKNEISKEEFEKRITENTLDEVMNYVPVKKGDIFFIEAGTLHAIGKGILIAEIQQNSNTTYRVSDYGRLGADGKPRELHVKKALDVTKTEKPTIPYGAVGHITEHSFGSVRTLAECEYFSVKAVKLNGGLGINLPKFVSVLVLEGDIALKYEDGIINAKSGDSVYIPENCTVMISGKGEFVLSTEGDQQ